MRRRRLLFPPRATLLGLGLFLLGLAVPFIGCAWLTIGSIAVADHGGWRAIGSIPRQSWVIPAIPTYFTHFEKGVAAAGFFISLIPTALCGNWTTRLWRYLVVHKYKWMTNEQVDDFLKRDPGW